MTRLSARLRDLAPQNKLLIDNDDKLLPRATGGKVVDRGGWVIVVPAHGNPALGLESGTGTSLAAQISARLDTSTWWRAEGKSVPIYLAVEDGASRAAVAGAVKVARSTGLRGELRRLVGEAPPAIDAADAALLARPSVRPLRDKLVKASFIDRAVLLGSAMQKAIVPCTAIAKRLGPTDQDVTKLPDAARECRCRMADLDLFEFALLSSVRAFDPRLRWLPERE